MIHSFNARGAKDTQDGVFLRGPRVLGVTKNWCLIFAIALISNSVSALPFNDDMVVTPFLRPGSSARGKVPGTVPIGSLAYYVANKDEAAKLSNPVPASAASISRGKRFYEINCSVCHGTYSSGTRTKGSVAEKSMMEGPDIGGATYKDRADGFFYGTILFGGLAVMPPLGFKLAPGQSWDIVNYLRHLQNAG